MRRRRGCAGEAWSMAVAAAFALANTGPAHAAAADCLLTIAERSYIDGPCDWDPQPDGSFTISAGPYFATLLIDSPGVGHGYWNETPGAQHAHTRLGEMRRDRACWANATASICAWKPGERKDAGR